MFRAIKVKAKSGRGGMDAADTWSQMMNNGQYEDILNQYKAAAPDVQEAARALLNEIQDDFGNLFYENKQMAEMAWAEGDSENQDKLAEFMKENMIAFDE